MSKPPRQLALNVWTRITTDDRLLAVVAELGVAVGTFTSAVIVGRRLDDAAFGQFASGMAGSLLTTAATTALVVEPYLLEPDERRRSASYRRSITRFASLFFGLIGAVVAAIALVSWLAGLADKHVLVLVGVAIVSPGQADFIYRRRVAQDRGTQLSLVSASIVYTLLAVGATLVVTSLPDPSLLHVFLVLGAAAALAGRFAYWGEARGRRSATIGTIRSRHLSYARWALPARGVSWMSTNAVFVLGPFIFGYAILGQFRMGYSLYQAGARMFPPLAVGLMPHIARTYREALELGLGEDEAARRSKRWAITKIAIPLSGAAVLLAVASPLLIRLFYGSRFTSGAWLAVAASLMIIPASLAVSLRTVLRSTGRVHKELGAEAIGLAAGLSLFPLMLFFDGIWAPMVGFVILVGCALTALLIRT